MLLDRDGAERDGGDPGGDAVGVVGKAHGQAPARGHLGDHIEADALGRARVSRGALHDDERAAGAQRRHRGVELGPVAHAGRKKLGLPVAAMRSSSGVLVTSPEGTL